MGVEICTFSLYLCGLYINYHQYRRLFWNAVVISVKLEICFNGEFVTFHDKTSHLPKFSYLIILVTLKFLK